MAAEKLENNILNDSVFRYQIKRHHLSGCSQVYLSKKRSCWTLGRSQRSDSSEKNQKHNLVSSFAFPNCGLSSLFFVHGYPSGLKFTDAGDTELYWQSYSQKKRALSFEKFVLIQRGSWRPLEVELLINKIGRPLQEAVAYKRRLTYFHYIHAKFIEINMSHWTDFTASLREI